MKTRLYLCTKGIEVDKPSGGGHGPDALYTISVAIDGKPALHLTRHDFKEAGQMHAFVEILGAISAKDISETLP